MDSNGEYHGCDECDWRKPGEWHKCTILDCGVWHRPATDEEESRHWNDVWDKLVDDL